MFEIMQFIFSDFWVWLGTWFLLALPCWAVAHHRIVSVVVNRDEPAIIKPEEGQ